MAMNRQLVSVELKYDDGVIERSTSPEHAQELMKWYWSCESLACVHGAKYTGKKFELVLPEGNNEGRSKG